MSRIIALSNASKTAVSKPTVQLSPPAPGPQISISDLSSTEQSPNAIDGRDCAALNSRNEYLLKGGYISLSNYTTNKRNIIQAFMDGKSAPILIGDNLARSKN